MTNFSVEKKPMLQSSTDDIFSGWVREHADVLYQYALKHGFDEQTAKDIIQDTFLSAWHGMDNYRAHASVRNWLFVILKNKITDHFRKTVNRINIQSLHDDDDHSFFDDNDHWKEGMHPAQWSVNFNNPAEVKDFRQIFNGCTRKLKQIQMVVFNMKYVDNIQSEIICKEMGISSSNYWVILHRAKVQLRACLEKNWLAK